MDDLFQQVWPRFLRVIEVVDESISTGSYQDLEERLSDELNRLGRFIIKQTVEAVDERLRDQPKERRGWVVERREDVKEVLTPFGPVRYHRTYFKNKVTAQYGYLADDWMGLTPHVRMTPSIRASLAERAAEASYRRSGQWCRNEAWHLSGQTVMNALRENPNWEVEWTQRGVR